MAYDTFTLSGTYRLVDGTPASGAVTVIPSAKLIKDAAGNAILSGRVKVTLDATGSFSTSLPDPNDNRLAPSGFGYTIVEILKHRTFAPRSFGKDQIIGGVLNVDDITPVDTSTLIPTVVYSTASEVAAADAAVLVSAQAYTDQHAASGASLFVNVKDYGAIGNNTADDTTAIQAAVNALSAGGTLFLPAGRYRVTSSITVAKPCIIQGAATSGANPSWGSRIVIDTANGANGLVLTADHIRVCDLAIASTTPAANITAGAGIYVNGGNFITVERCRIGGHYRGVEVNVGYGWVIANNYIVNNAQYSLYIKDVGNVDAGDPVLHGNDFDCDGTNYSTAAHIRYESGGGLKMTANKVLHGQMAIDLQIADASATSILVMTGNSFENQTVNMWRFGRAAGTTGTFSRIVCTGNQLTGSACSSDVISIGQNGGIGEVLIANNTIFGNSSQMGVNVYSGDNINITGNSITSCLVGVQLQSSVGNAEVRNKLQNCGTQMIDLRGASTITTGIIDWTTVQSKFVSSTSTPTSFMRVALIDRQGTTIEVDAQGTIESGVSGFSAKATRIASRNGASAAVTLTTVGTDAASANAPTITFDTSATTGAVVIGLQRSASDGGVGASCRVRVRAGNGVERILLL